ncbi:Thiolase [Penicillium cinerascens]|uniref:Thiolase n=1 Tax=Penicillium cinerascens TaxID=70096 RepID=A0A9W9N8V1_9EURO|nr:Thiolase [Penicillium cinerascens]KAJ5215385.1 Thiolase [Penicillium cinerascens]
MIPVIIGVADIKNRSIAVDDAKEPATLMLEAIGSAIQDATTSREFAEAMRSSIDSIDVVRTWTWPYADLPGLLSEKLGVQTKHRGYSEHGGNQPAKLLDEAARRIATGENKVAVLTGAEALASCKKSFRFVVHIHYTDEIVAACVKQGKVPPSGWTTPAESVKSVFSPTTRELKKEDIGGLHSVGAPIHIYPLYENGFRAHRGQSIKDNHEESTALYADFSKVAASNPYSWNHGNGTETAQSIGTVSKKNRMICFPYPLLMNAFNTVNLGAACILTSTEFAKQLQVPREKWIYPLGGAGFKERDLFWERPNFFESSAISNSLDQCLGASELTGNEIDVYDFYSCFPIVPKLACHHLGISITEPKKPITVLGGLTSFGGAGNNYSMHAITEMVRRLRQGAGHNGLILANGGFLSYQHAICISTQPRKTPDSYPDSRALHSGPADPIPPIDSEAEGEAKIETYTVEFNRDGSPEQAYIVGRLTGSNHRFLANHGDQITLKRLASSSEEPIGKVGTVVPDPTGEKGQRRNLFYLNDNSRL